MKLRIGFVTNSSSTCFVALGINIDDREFSRDAYINVFNKICNTVYGVRDVFRSVSKPLEEISDEEKINYVKNLDPYEFVNVLVEGTYLSADFGPYGNYVGYELSRIFEDFPDLKVFQLRGVIAEEFKKIGLEVRPDELKVLVLSYWN